MTLAGNTDTSAKKKVRGKPFAKGDPRINKAGAPKRGESWGEIINRIGNMTPIEAAEHAKAIAGKLKVMGDAITLKEAVIIRAYAALLFEPQPGLMNIFMDRAEGKVREQVDVTSAGQALEIKIVKASQARIDSE